MLTDLRRVLPLGVAMLFGVGKAVVGAGVGGGRCVLEGARSPLRGVLGAVKDLPGVATPPVFFRVFWTGRAGRADVGGPIEGRDGRGKAPVAMITHVQLFCWEEQ
jgi:hypothetical protein